MIYPAEGGYQEVFRTRGDDLYLSHTMRYFLPIRFRVLSTLPFLKFFQFSLKQNGLFTQQQFPFSSQIKIHELFFLSFLKGVLLSKNFWS